MRIFCTSEQNLWLAAHHFSFWYWKLGGTVKKITLYKCVKCKVSFGQRGHPKQHLLTHTRETVYNCAKFLIFYFFSLRVYDPLGAGGRGSKNLGNGWSKSIVSENKVVLNFDIRNGVKKNQVNRATCSRIMAFFSERVKWKSPLKLLSRGQFCRESRFSFFLAGYHAQGHYLNVFLNFSESIFTPKEWFLSKKGPKEGERVARGHFHERVGESPGQDENFGANAFTKSRFVPEIWPFEKKVPGQNFPK